ncbi:hypothetical protein T12_8437 [Trichinella patagoniensis]|uniref:Uncharacterized protein n=1 Tax=Trichinella patagoniensis TaxID=990121 RepID=A0A0V1ACL7_9BILA|nr:hypothetical protein T12_8437 [Trichinella patagoniensis]
MCGYLIVLSLKKSTNKYTNIPCLSKTAANSSNSISIKGKLQNVMGYRLVILAKMAKKIVFNI